MKTEEIIRKKLQPVMEQLKSVKGLDKMFEQCFLNTVETTVQSLEEGDTFVITGDIEAMWLRDSTAQVLHYLRFADEPCVASMADGLIARQVRCILEDAYANAFNREASGRHCDADIPVPGKKIWERKYEIDSLCYPLLLAHKVQEATGRQDFMTKDFHRALRRIVDLFWCEQHHENSPYRFERPGCDRLSDTLPYAGKGNPVAYTGMTWSGFRPSDDACTYGYLIPSNLFAVKALEYLTGFARLLGDNVLVNDATKLRDEIRRGISAFGVTVHPDFGEIYAYETDGRGNYNLMDDANVPSLLSLPYLEACAKDDPMYLRTRKFVLSQANPCYGSGEKARGVGSWHTPKNYVWPISLCMQIMTSADDAEAADLLKTLLTTHAGTGFMHESFDPDDPEVYTRKWFAWANSLFGETLYRLYEEGRLENILAMTGLSAITV